MTADPFTEDDRRLIVTVREHLRWLDSQPHPQRHWIDETRGLIDGTLHRVWHPNPDYMTPGEPVGYWSTEKRK
jgi:hypothetical protein